MRQSVQWEEVNVNVILKIFITIANFFTYLFKKCVPI